MLGFLLGFGFGVMAALFVVRFAGPSEERKGAKYWYHRCQNESRQRIRECSRYNRIIRDMEGSKKEPADDPADWWRNC